MAYWDTSALLKLYVTESDSPYFDSLAETSEPIFSSEIVIPETLCALHRKEHSGDLRRGGARTVFRKFSADIDAGRIVTIPYGRDVIAEAQKVVALAYGRPKPFLIRSLDVIHIASAVVSKARALIATDTRLREAAALVGLDLIP